ncbi:MAG TPA: choice-of-anchor L domain-containing protein, partial [Thermoanaerobaculia bacterium]
MSLNSPERLHVRAARGGPIAAVRATDRSGAPLMVKSVGLFAGSLVLFLAAQSTLAVTTTDLNTLTPAQLAQMLAGPGVTVSNVTFTGANVAGGSFTGGLADGLGIDSGIILSSGNVANAVGPNTDDGITTVNETPGDADLNVIVGAGHSTFDAAVLQFDFVPSSSTVNFRYVFASDEYNEFVGQINDVFAFYIDGQNVALIPGTTTPIAINTVNLQTNSQYYKNNDPSDLMPPPFGTQFDGFTTVLTATATLQAGVSHHIKLAIADTDDSILDSAVFLQAASFTSQNLTISKSAPATVASGGNLTYTITYGNTGDSSATNVIINDHVPAGTTFVSATNGGTLVFQDPPDPGLAVIWNIGTLGGGVTGQTVQFTVHVDATSGTITNSNYKIGATNAPTTAGAPVSTSISGGCPTINLSPATLPGGSLSSPYNQTITASGGSAPYSFFISDGTLPPGLMLSSTGVISGTPTAGGSYSFTVRVFDANECSGSRSYTLSITGGCGALAISPSVLFEGFVGVAYNRTLHGVGGFAPYTFSVTSGALPPGLSLSSSGVISGTPTAAGSFTFRIRVADSSGCSASQNYTVTISCPPVVLSPATLPSASQNVPYVQTITAIGGGGPYTFSAGPGLPAGLTLLSSGAFSGAPSQSGTFSFTVTASDRGGCSVSQNFSLSVCAALAISPATLPGALSGTPYSQALSASGGTAPYSFVQTGLPSPMTLSAAGVISGTPAAPGVFTVTVTVTDAVGCTGVKTYTFNVCAVIVLSPATLPGGAVGVAYGQSVTASGGTAPYRYTAVGFPTALTISPSTGAISGTPTAAGTINVNVTATDANGCAASRSYTIVVTDAPPVISGLTLSPAAPGSFNLSVAGSGFVNGAVVVINGVTYPATFGS